MMKRIQCGRDGPNSWDIAVSSKGQTYLRIVKPISDLEAVKIMAEQDRLLEHRTKMLAHHMEEFQAGIL